MKIIVTGGAGFIASHVADAYIRAGHRVVILDNLSTGSRRNINPKAKFYKADVRNGGFVERIFKKERPQLVNHHAALINVTKSVKDPLGTLQTNVLGTANVLIALGKYGEKNKKIVFASSGGSIYGNSKRIPADENTEASPLSPYALSKLLAEETIVCFAKEYGIDYIILRYANVYGSRQKNGVVPIFTALMRRGKRPTIFGNGKKTRDYVYVEDVAVANVKAINKGAREILNIGSEKEISDQAVFNAIAENLNFRGKPIYVPRREGEVERIALSIHRAKKLLGWAPKISFQKGIKKMLSIL